MSSRRAPWFACLLLRQLARTTFSESLEGDLLEEFAAGRSRLWFWGQVLAAMAEQVRTLARRRTAVVLAATAFFVLSLGVIAPATYPVMNWVRAAEPWQTPLMLCWLMGVPFLLGGIAGTARKLLPLGCILTGAGLAYLTPVTLPFEYAVCDLCTKTGSAVTPAAALFMTPLGSALLAGCGAWAIRRLTYGTAQELSG